MFTSTELTAGAARLVDGKLTPKDIDAIVTVLRKYFKHLETQYSYEYREKLEAIDDTSDTRQTAAQIGAALNKLEDFGFGSAAALAGGADAILFKEKDRYFEYVEIIFTKLYPMPVEMGPNGIIRRVNDGRKSSTVRLVRSEGCWDSRYPSEQELRRGT